MLKNREYAIFENIRVTPRSNRHPGDIMHSEIKRDITPTISSDIKLGDKGAANEWPIKSRKAVRMSSSVRLDFVGKWLERFRLYYIFLAPENTCGPFY